MGYSFEAKVREVMNTEKVFCNHIGGERKPTYKEACKILAARRKRKRYDDTKEATQDEMKNVRLPYID